MGIHSNVESEARVDFSLPARAENVALVRHALAGLAEVLGMGPSEIADLKTVVTEACTNVVLHAYPPDEIGPMQVRATPEREALQVFVRDFGQGIRPLADPERQSLRLGLPLIAALSDGFRLAQNPGGGTALTMRMPYRSEERAEDPCAQPRATEELRLEAEAGEALAPVLSRVISMFATRADFSVDKLSDAVLLGDAIGSGDGRVFPQGVARITIVEKASSFEISVGPLASGGGERLLSTMQIPHINASLEQLTQEVRVETDEQGERLVVRLSANGLTG